MSGNSSRIASVVSRFGGQTKLAKLLGCSQGTVWGWLDAGFVPSQRIPEIIEAGRRLDPPVLLRPDDFFEVASAPLATGAEAA